MSSVYLTDSDEYKLLRTMRICMTSLVKISRTKLGRSHKLSVKVCKTWFDLQRTHCGKRMQSKSEQAPKEMTECQTWIQDKLGFLRSHIRCKRLSK